MIDRFGREIVFDGEKYICGGIEIFTIDADQALNTFNAMAPDGWIEE